MTKYNVWGSVGADKLIGTYEADSPEEAEKMADKDPEADWSTSLCHQCSHEVELGDIYKTYVEETDDE